LPYIGRVFWSFMLGVSPTVTAYRSELTRYFIRYQKAAAHVYAPHLAERQGLVSGFTFDFDTQTYGIISHVNAPPQLSNTVLTLESPGQVAMHTAYVKEFDLLPYLVLTTTTGAVQLWRGDIVQWTREEGLSRLQVAEMVELPERKTTTAHVIDQNEVFVERIRRQLTNAKVRSMAQGYAHS
jgi:ER membrane protein complex subunit 1